MGPEESVIIRDFLVTQIEEEVENTARVLAAVPEAQRDYRPDPVSRSPLELAWHIAGAEKWFLDGIVGGEFGDRQQETLPEGVSTIADVLSWYSRNIPARIEQLKAMTGEDLTRGTDVAGGFPFPKVIFLLLLLLHSVHHRGQLTAYLRPMGTKVPSIYGDSADGGA